jgi:Leucine-rich repeat (LRR) protein
MHSAIFFILCAIRLSFAVKTQTVNIDCDFVVSGGDYICRLCLVEVNDVENQKIVIRGRHEKDRNDDDVTMVMLFNSATPFVMTQIFTSFSSVKNVIFHNSGIERIQRDALANARSLQQLTITSNPRLKVIPAGAFQGASELTHLVLGGNQIELISLVAFNGLTSLRFLFLSQNRIRFLPLNTFRPLISLQHLVISLNLIDSIDGRLFINNNQLKSLDISANNINGIEKTALDRLTNLQKFDARSNKCINRMWLFPSELDKVQEHLKFCFENFIGLPEERSLKMEIRGTITIQDEYGNEIVRL